MKKKSLIIGLLALLLAVPATAVLKEQDLTETLGVLLSELKKSVAGLHSSTSYTKRMADQHQGLVELVKRSNELSVVMYSQKQGNTFELTYALNSATRQYEGFQQQKLPFDEILTTIHQEWSRYRRLSQALSKIPPEKSDIQLPKIVVDDVEGMDADSILLSIPTFAAMDSTLLMDEHTAMLRDSCVLLSDQLADYYYERIQAINEDSGYYEETDALLKEAYDYAQERYRVVQRQVFLDGTRDYPTILKRYKSYYRRAKRDLVDKYGTDSGSDLQSNWQGPMVWTFAFLMLVMMVVAILLSNILVRLCVWVIPGFNKPVIRENKGMIITLSGIVLFILFCILWFDTSYDNFYGMAGRIMVEFAILLGAIFLSMFICLDKEQRHQAIKACVPFLLLDFLVIFFRIIFIPDSALNLFFPPLALLFTICQLVVNIIYVKSLPTATKALLWLTFTVMTVCTVLSWCGLVMMSLLIFIWWLFQLMLLLVIFAVDVLVEKRFKSKFTERQMQYRKKHPYMPLSSDKSSYIEISWFYDLSQIFLFPVLGIWSLPVAINLSCHVFNLNNVASRLFMEPLIQIENVLNLSLFKLILVISLFFLFRYLVYAGKAFYRVWRTRAAIKKLKDPTQFKESDINFNLANNIISLAGWGIFVIAAFVMLKIPTKALTIVTTGLATGIGFALKDVLNNFFYGIQLMSGRVRVGDTIECDGIRGKVEALSYQSTQVAAEDGSLIVFTNSSLFNKNFKNLTRNHQYEMVKILVGVKYGTDVERARQIIKDALEPLVGKDKYGRDIVDMHKGIIVRLNDFGDSSVDISVILFVAVEYRYTLTAKMKEAIYNAFNENGIEIPFPQLDVYMKQQ